jgi:hypothetical protein
VQRSTSCLLWAISGHAEETSHLLKMMRTTAAAVAKDNRTASKILILV